jgi:hypothetical protein
MPTPDAGGEVGWRLKGACAAAREGGEHGHELKIVDLAVRACALARRGATPQPAERRVGGATAPGVSRQNRRSRGLYAEGHPPKEGGGLCPNHGSSRTKRSHGLAR